MTSSTRQPRGSGSRRRVRPAPTGQSYLRRRVPRASRCPAELPPGDGQTDIESRAAARRPHTIDMTTMCATLLLRLIIGLIALFSASYSSALYSQGSATYFIVRQLRWAAVGLVAMYVLSRIDYHGYVMVVNPAIVISVALLILVLIPGVGTTTKGATHAGCSAFSRPSSRRIPSSSRSPRGPRPSTRICST